MTALLTIWLACFGIAGALPAIFPDTALLPPDGFLKAWKKAENPRVFTASDLYGHIDGGAEIFLEFGFEQLTVQPYSPIAAGAAKTTADEFKIEIYRMADPIAATGIYLMNCGKESQDPSFQERHSLNQFQLIFKRDRYYVIVNNSEGNEKLRLDMLEFGRFIAGRLPRSCATWAMRIRRSFWPGQRGFCFAGPEPAQFCLRPPSCQPMFAQV